MTQQVVFELGAKDAECVRAWQAMKNNIGAVEGQLGRLDGAQKKNAKSAKDFDEAVDWKTMIGGAVQTAGAFGGIGGAIATASAYQKQLLEDLEKTSLEMDELIRKYQVQAGLKDFEKNGANAAILDIAEANAVTSKDAHAVTTQLVSSGYASPETSGTSDALLKILASSNLDANKGAEVAKSMGQFITAFGEEKNAANLLDLGVRTRGLFEKTDVQLGDLGAFAQAAPAFANAGVNKQDTLSALGILRETEDPGMAATHGRNVVGLMTTFAKEKDKVKLIKDLGGDASKMDLSGESLPEALTYLKGLIENGKLKTDAEKSGALKTLFGQENTVGASALLKGIDKFKQFGEYQNNTEGFEQGVRVNQSGPNAQLKRIQVRKERERLKYSEGANTDALLKEEFKRKDEELALDARSMGAGGFFMNMGTGVKGFARDTMLATGAFSARDIASDEDMANIKRGADSNFSLKELKDSLDANTKATNEATKAANGGGMAQGGPPRVSVSVVPAGSGAPAKPVAGAAIGGNQPR